MNIQGLYSTLLNATFGGLPFAVIDTTEEVGRRNFQFLFPGIDAASYQDLGASDGPIVIRGILAGDDYVAQATAMKAIWRSAGPYTLNHPWLGTLQVVWVPNTRPKMSLAANELRIARMEMQVMRFAPTAQAGLDTLSQLELRCDALTADAENWLANAMQPAVAVLGAFGYAQNWVSGIANIFSQAIATTASADEIGTAAAGALAVLAAPTTAPSPTWGATTAADVAALPAAVAGACTPTVPSAVAPGGTTTAAAAADPTDTVNTLLATIPGITAGSANPAPGPALAAAAQAMVVGAAVQASVAINYTSQQQALAQAAVLYAAIDAAVTATGTAAQSDPADAAPVYRDLIGLKAALAADLNSLVGRLPPVVTIHIPRTMPAWLIAQYISGDDPAQVVATYQDIIARNNIFNPALVPAGPLEVLNV